MRAACWQHCQGIRQYSQAISAGVVVFAFTYCGVEERRRELWMQLPVEAQLPVVPGRQVVEPDSHDGGRGRRPWLPQQTDWRIADSLSNARGIHLVECKHRARDGIARARGIRSDETWHMARLSFPHALAGAACKPEAGQGPEAAAIWGWLQQLQGSLRAPVASRKRPKRHC